MKDKNTIKDLLGIDIEDMGLAEAIDNVTTSSVQMNRVHEAIGKAIFKDGGLLEGGLKVHSDEIIKDIVWNDNEIMLMLEFYASKSEKFMERL